MNVSEIQGVQSLIGDNPFTIFNSILLIFTAYLSYTAFKFQNRTSIRESLEQLDSADLGGRGDKLTPILHSFKFRILRKSETIVKLRSYFMSSEPAAASETHHGFLHLLIHSVTVNEDDFNLTREDIEAAFSSKVGSIDGVEDAWIEGNGLFIRFNSRNAVKIREITERVVDSISEWYHRRPENLMEHLDMDIDDYS